MRGIDNGLLNGPANRFALHLHFLDVLYAFGFDGALVTDVYIKDTDSRTYLNFHSYHPKYVFNSIVYSQALRFRRIINNDEVLDMRLNDLYKYFRLSDYIHITWLLT